MDEQERNDLNELALAIVKESDNKLLKIPGVRAVLTTFVGDENVPIGTIIYSDKYDNGFTLLAGINSLARHIIILSKALGEQSERNNSKSVGGSGEKQADAQGSTKPHHDAHEATGSSSS